MKDQLEILSIAMLLSLAIALTVVFDIAVLNGGSTTVYVNQYGEMIPEPLLLHVVVWPTISVGIHRLYQRYRTDT